MEGMVKMEDKIKIDDKIEDGVKIEEMEKTEDIEKRILITGANGQLGRALNQVLKAKNNISYRIINTDLGEATAYCPISLDIMNPVAVMNLVQSIKPDIIINCAALTAVDLCESEGDMAYRINAIGPKNLAKAADEMDAKFVHISTDYVFDGEGTTPYTEEDTPSPKSVYGTTKYQGEELVKSNCVKYFILRTAWVYGEGKNFVKTMLRLSDEREEIKVVDDQYGTPTSAVDLAKAIAVLMETNEYGLYHCVNKGVTTWYEFAKEIFRLFDKKVTLLPIKTEEYPTPAKRPAYSVLDTNKINSIGIHMRPWEEALKEYMEETIVKNKE